MTSRRHVLSLLAAAPFAPGLAACAPQNLPDPAAGWRDPGAGEADPRRFALAHAILAPNPHNTQPWLVELRGDDEMALYCDLDRRLPFTDPLDRQITIGCGCFLELYRIAANARGFEVAVTPFPEGEPSPRLDTRPLASVRIAAAATADPPNDLSAAKGRAVREATLGGIRARRTNRNNFDLTRIPEGRKLAAIAQQAEGAGTVSSAVDPARVAQIRDLVWRAFDREMHTAGALEETFGWLRFGRTEIARRRDGLAIDGPLIPLFKSIGQLDREELINPNSQANKQAAAEWRRKAETSPAFMWLTTPMDTPLSRINAGMAYARMNLAATAAGLAIHPWSQALQEYDEMADLYAEARELLGAGDQTVQMLVRIGYADPVAPAARRDLGDFIRA